MKPLHLTLLVFLLSAQVWALGDNGFGWGPVSVSAGYFNSCVLDVEGVKCWGVGQDQLNLPVLKFPTQISVGYFHSCALDSEGVKCWGGNDYGQANVPALKSPTQVSAGHSHTCALDAEGVKCWGLNDFGQTNVPILKSPTQVSAGWWYSCALDADGVKCWGNGDYGQTEVPALNSPIQISAGSAHACALDKDGVKCWGSNGSDQTKVPPLKSPTQVSVGGHHTCALDKEGVKCWGSYSAGQLAVPVLNSPIQVSAGVVHTCALDADGVKCWGHNSFDKSLVPEVSFDLIGEAILLVTSARAEYLKTAFAVRSKAYYLASLIASPVIFSMDSSYFIESFNPKFKKLIEKLQSKFGYTGDIREVPDAEENRKLAIASIQSALSVSLNFVSPDQKVILQDGVRTAGVALAAPMDNQKVLDLLKQVDALVTEKQKLRSSTKSAFLVDSLDLAANWLREKVK